MEDVYINIDYWNHGIPTWENGEWTHTIFETNHEFIDFLKPLFKEPGQYEFDETAFLFNKQAQKFNKDGVFCDELDESSAFIKYWDTEKEKCRRGAIYKNNGKIWYLPKEYYMWLNFLRIYDKISKTFRIANVWDVQYHMALYELLAELHGKHAVIVKKRQMASSYYHCAKLICELWFEEGPTLKMGASESRHIDEDGSWAFIDEYRDFLNEHTAWYRPMEPNKIKNWQQKISVDVNGRTKTIGGKGRLIGLSFEKSATKGVGGACRYFFYEEAGVAPTMDKSYIYMLSALETGDISTGMFIAAGSVGELKHCDPLKEFILNPVANDFYAVETTLRDDLGTPGLSGLFIPEHWSMPPYIDEFGNSKAEEALEALNVKYAEWKKKLKPETYQLRVSQRPRTIEEAFAYREESIFPMNRVLRQEQAIDDGDYPYEAIELSYKDDRSIKVSKTTKLPNLDFPMPKAQEDKTGVIQVWERPDEGAEWGTYYGAIDPVAEGKTTTSDSLCSIYIYKNPTHVTRYNVDGVVENFIEGDKIVATWCGRFDDINKTHERLELIIEWYNAWTIVENNVSLFIQYMILKRKQQYLVPKNQIAFLKEIQANQNVHSEYGWRNVGRIFKEHLLSYYIEWLTEEISHETKPDGTITKTIYGISRIPDKMVMVEMKNYGDGVNVDRLVTIASLIAFAKVQQANRGYKKRLEDESHKSLEKSQDLFKLKKSPFSSRRGKGGGGRSDRSPFKNMK